MSIRSLCLNIPAACLLLPLLVATLPVKANGILTLFTTPEERQLINSNRFRVEEPEVVSAPVEQVEPEAEIETPYTQEVRSEYRISGITLSREGASMVWVNGEVIEDGQETPDGSQVKVLSGQTPRIQIVAPDGSRFEGEIGDTIEVVYEAPVKG